ncbi:hypothetical protein POTOM_048694 [Populus tomentosa]|uniref:SAM domain-containing protein n=1 Tax=Populus tomentosa TaxID=118781 RepID=A0A8X8C4T8_POPTO|nr:hypothetical protein POTOM_048694 [Populus tomentosa]
MSKERPPEPLDFFIWTVESVMCKCNSQGFYARILLHSDIKWLWFSIDVGLWLEEINLGSYRQIFKDNGVNGEYLEGMSMFTTEQILRFIRRCHMKWGDFITLCKELRRIKGSPSVSKHSCAECRHTHTFHVHVLTCVIVS